MVRMCTKVLKINGVSRLSSQNFQKIRASTEMPRVKIPVEPDCLVFTS